MDAQDVVFSFYQIKPVALDALQAGNDVEFLVTGESMRPLLRHEKDRVRIRRCEPKPGDAVFYLREDGSYILHRLIRIEKDGTCCICGDNQYRLEKGVRRDRILGVMTHYARPEKWKSCEALSYKIYRRLRIWSIFPRRVLHGLRRRLLKNVPKKGEK